MINNLIKILVKVCQFDFRGMIKFQLNFILLSHCFRIPSMNKFSRIFQGLNELLYRLLHARLLFDLFSCLSDVANDDVLARARLSHPEVTLFSGGMYLQRGNRRRIFSTERNFFEYSHDYVEFAASSNDN